MFISSALKPCLAPSSLMTCFLLCSRKFGTRSHFAHMSCYGFILYTVPNSPWNRGNNMNIKKWTFPADFWASGFTSLGTFRGRKSTTDRYNSTPEDVMDEPRALTGLGAISAPWTIYNWHLGPSRFYVYRM